jgi:hypothetical protein
MPKGKGSQGAPKSLPSGLGGILWYEYYHSDKKQ